MGKRCTQEGHVTPKNNAVSALLEDGAHTPHYSLPYTGKNMHLKTTEGANNAGNVCGKKGEQNG